MTPTAATPPPVPPPATGHRRVLDPDDVVVTRTDPRGVITAVNDTFVRLSGLLEDDLLGSPHSVVRHPAMPRAVFALMWQRLGEGEDVYAYVVNRCADGSHWWVLLHARPERDGGGRCTGHRAEHRAPLPGSVAQVEPLYAHLVAVESAAPDPAAAVLAGGAALAAALEAAGTTYDAWVWSLAGGAAGPGSPGDPSAGTPGGPGKPAPSR